MSVGTIPASSWCANCGTRLIDSMDFVICEAPESPQRFLYLLCRGCAAAVHVGDREAVLVAVEQRVQFIKAGWV